MTSPGSATSALCAAAEACALSPLRTVGPDTAERPFRFAEAFLGFQGHFPGYPVLPAFVQLLLAQGVAEGLIGEPVRLSGVSRAKFLAQVRPDQMVLVTCKRRGEGLPSLVEASITADGTLAATLLLQFSQPPEGLGPQCI